MSETFKRYFYIFFLILFYTPLQLSAADNDGSRYAANSVLADGKWYKIKIPATGIYKLTYDDLKNKLGLTNPANVRIYGYGGWALDEDFSKPYVDDLPEVSVWMSKEPAEFGKDDYILFFARGDIKWKYNNDTREFEQTQNPYSRNSYYFVTESSEGPLLMDTQPSLPAGANVVTTFNDYLLHENESENIGQSGRTLYGENFTAKTNNSENFTLKTAGATGSAIIRYDFVSHITFNGGQSLSATLNGGRTKLNFAEVIPSSDSYFAFGTTINDTIITNNLQNENTLNLTFKKVASSDKNLYLNYIRVNYKRLLKPYGAVTLFRNTDNINSNLTYRIADANSSLMVFDVTGNTVVRKMDTGLSGSVLSFTASNTDIREYALVDLSKTIPSPVLEDKSDLRMGKIANQNLHAKTGYDMVIIVQPFLQTYAQQLADLHEKDSGLKSLIVNPDDIYNEFSSGKPDVTAYRRFMKMFYDRSSGGDDRPKYLLLFGGGTYDNHLQKSIWSDAEKKSMLLTYQSENSLRETLSYSTDDYMGFLDDSEGKAFGDNTFGNDILDISIGRLPVRNEDEAADVVAKIQSYVENKNVGIWQNDILYVADDLVGSASSTNETWPIFNTESLADYSNTNYPNFITSKIYEDAFERVVQANGSRYPAATKALLDKINQGALVLNFVGHGTTRSWTHENLLTYTDIESLKNEKLGLWITATCDFSRFDADARSGGELLILKKTGGAIALFSTVRTVYINNNKTMNDRIAKYLLEKDKDGKPARLGDIMRNAKSEMLGDVNKLRFLLLGDPALRLSFPDDTYKVEVTEMNGKAAGEEGINIQALDNAVIVGHIVDKSGAVATNFNGTLESVIFDSEQSLTTKGNKPDGTQGKDRETDYKAYTNILFSGKIKVVNGAFRIEFTAPKDILYTDAKGKMSFLAYDGEGKNKAQGSFYNYTVGGTNTNVPEEFDGPVIEELYLNNKEFESGGYVNSTPLFYAKVSDITGINLTNAIAHNIALIIDGNTEYNLTPYFENEDGSSKKGSVTFRIPELALGNHTLTFRVWDVWNNSTTSETIDFIVSNENNFSGYTFDIWGNPAKEMTRFVFGTEAPGVDVDIKLSVYTLTGRMIWTQEARSTADSLNQCIVDWNLNGDSGGRILPGVYICIGQVTVNGKKTSVKSRKLIVSSSY